MAFLLYFGACISILSNQLTEINLNDIFRGMNKKNSYVTHKATCDVWNTSIENGHRPCTCGLQKDGTYKPKLSLVSRMKKYLDHLYECDKTACSFKEHKDTIPCTCGLDELLKEISNE